MEKILATLYLWKMTATDKVAAKIDKAEARAREGGQGSLEYIGMIAIAALIVAAVAIAVQQVGIGQWVKDAIGDMKKAPDAQPG